MTEAEERILERERLLAIQASERLGQWWGDFDDLVQEGRIALWEVATKRPDAPGAYFNAAAGMRISEAAARGKWTGMPSQRGKPSVDPLRRPDRDSLDERDDEGHLIRDVALPDITEALQLAYHAGELRQAIDCLPANHQRYVVLRFWYGMTHTEIAEHVGIKAGNLARTWNESIRPALAERLAHLKGY